MFTLNFTSVSRLAPLGAVMVLLLTSPIAAAAAVAPGAADTPAVPATAATTEASEPTAAGGGAEPDEPAIAGTADDSASATAGETADRSAPSTDDISGVLVPEDQSSASPARALLVVPRTVASTVATPVRGGLVLYERHHVRERLLDFFFNDERTFGVYPVVALETGLPTGVGARLIHRDLFGHAGRLRLIANYGGDSRHRLEGAISSPRMGGLPVRLRLGGGWLRQPRAPFFGIGEQGLVVPDEATRALPARGPFAVATTFRQDVLHAELATEIDPDGPLFAALGTTYLERRFDDARSPSSPDDPVLPGDLGRIDFHFDTTTLNGWGQGTRVAYSELLLGWDTLRASRYVPSSAPSSGTKVVAFAGLARNVAGADVSYTRYGVDAIHYFDLFNGDRVLIIRGRVEGVAGAADRIPFTDLPRLGGPGMLRGYARDRFRDRVAALASIEYRYPIWRNLSGFLFVDGGRVLPAAGDLADVALNPQRLRGAGGGGLEILAGDRFRMRTQLAGSPEGTFFQLALEPVYRLPTHNYRI